MNEATEKQKIAIKNLHAWIVTRDKKKHFTDEQTSYYIGKDLNNLDKYEASKAIAELISKTHEISYEETPDIW